MADKAKHDDPHTGKIRVFVYGTLKKGHSNHMLLENAKAEFVGYDSITGPFRMTDMIGFPGVYRPAQAADKDTPSNRTMRGEVWAIEPEGLHSLDYLEGHPTFYRREKFWTDKGVRAWMYSLSPQTALRAVSRGWLAPDRDLEEGLWSPFDDEVEYWEAA